MLQDFGKYIYLFDITLVEFMQLECCCHYRKCGTDIWKFML